MNPFQNDWTRRKFIASTTKAGLSIFFVPTLRQATDYFDPGIAAFVAQTFSIDAHNHIDIPSEPAAYAETKIDLVGQIKGSGLSAICMTFAVDRPKLTGPGQAFERFMTGLDAMDAFLITNSLTRSLNLPDLVNAHRENKPAVVQAVEGGHFLEGQLGRLETAYKRGLRMLGLLHDEQPAVPIGDIYTDPPRFGGLTEFGVRLVKECNKLGILIDLTHCSNTAINAALRTSTTPVIISHTGLDTQLGKDEKFAAMMRPRLISKEQAKIVADAGGVIGIWTHLSDTPLAYVQNIRAMIDVVGVDHVCIGTDTKMAKPSQTIQPNASMNQERAGERTNTVWENQKNGFYYAVVAEMLNTGFSESEITKIGGSNFCRVFDAATSPANTQRSAVPQ